MKILRRRGITDRVLWGCLASLAGVFFPGALGRAAEAASRTPSEKVLKAHLHPLARVELARGGLLSEWVSKNAWFRDLKGDLLGLGLSQEFGRTWLSLPDQEGPTAGAWKGVLLDAVFGDLLRKAPLSLLIFDSPALAASWALAVPSFRGEQSTRWESLLKRLETGGSFTVEDPLSRKKHEGQFLSLRGLRLALLREGGCVTVSLDPLLAARAQELCKPAGVLQEQEVSLQLQLDQFYPATRVLRKKVVGLESESRIVWKYDAASGSMNLIRGEIASDPAVASGGLAQAVPEANLFRALPAGTLHFSGVTLRPPKGFNFSVGAISEWLERKPAPSGDFLLHGMLAHLGFREKKALSVLLISQPEEKGSVFGGLLLKSKLFTFAAGLRSVFRSEKQKLAIRAVCKGSLWAISPHPEALDEVEETCAGKKPSLAGTTEFSRLVLAKEPVSVVAYFNPGAALSARLLLGMNQVKSEIPDLSVFDASRTLLARIPRIGLRGVYESGRRAVALQSTGSDSVRSKDSP
jgi:hypothetical protein